MSLIVKRDTNGVKPLLQTGEFGYDNYSAGGDSGRVYVGTGSENIPLAKKAEMLAVEGKVDVHIARVDNPHGVTKAQVGLGNVENLAPTDMPISSATQAALAEIADKTYSKTQIDTKLAEQNEASEISYDGTVSELVATNVQDAIDEVEGSVDILDSAVVKLTGDQTIDDVKTFSSSPIVPTPIADSDAVNKIYVDEATNRIGLIDYGYVAKNYHIVAFGGEFNRADYPKLWAYLQANPTLVKTQAQWISESTTNGGICGFFSDGNGTTTFRVPNLDKAFLRPDSRTIASYQGDAFKSHSHPETRTGGAGGGGTFDGFLIIEGSANNIPWNTSTLNTGGDETRPKNIAVLPLIVAK